MKIKRPAFVALPASDMEESIHFYKNLLELPVLREGEDSFSKFIQFDTGGLDLHIYEWKKPFNRAHTGLVVYVDDVDRLYAELKSQGVKFSGEIRDEPWGGRTVTVADPDGNLFDFLNIDYADTLS